MQPVVTCPKSASPKRGGGGQWWKERSHPLTMTVSTRPLFRKVLFADREGRRPLVLVSRWPVAELPFPPNAVGRCRSQAPEGGRRRRCQKADLARFDPLETRELRGRVRP